MHIAQDVQMCCFVFPWVLLSLSIGFARKVHMKPKPNMFFTGHENTKWFQRKPHPLCFKLWKWLCLPEMAFLRYCWCAYIPLCKEYPSFFESCFISIDSQSENIHVRYRGDRELQYKLWMLSSDILKIHITVTECFFLLVYLPCLHCMYGPGPFKSPAEFSPVN